MATVDDKLKAFAKIVFEKVETESEKKVSEFVKNQEQILETEKQNVIRESENLLKKTRKKAEERRRQIISKANIERQHTLLKKRKEIFDSIVDDIKSMAVSFTDTPEYMPFLEKSISSGFSRFEGQSAAGLFSAHDIAKYGEFIKEMTQKYKRTGMSVTIEEIQEEILGGCVFENVEKTMRIDCSMASILEENKGLIGSMLMDNLQ